MWLIPSQDPPRTCRISGSLQRWRQGGRGALQTCPLVSPGLWLGVCLFCVSVLSLTPGISSCLQHSFPAPSRPKHPQKDSALASVWGLGWLGREGGNGGGALAPCSCPPRALTEGAPHTNTWDCLWHSEITLTLSCKKMAALPQIIILEKEKKKPFSVKTTNSSLDSFLSFSHRAIVAMV